MTERSMTESVGTNVVAVNTAQVLGKVKEWIVDDSGTTIVRLQVGDRRHSNVVEWSQVSSFGPDAVMVTERPDTDPSVATEGGKADRSYTPLIGARILDTSGFDRGIVDDVMFDGSSGAITDVMAGDDHFVGTSIRGFGSYALVVEAGAADTATP